MTLEECIRAVQTQHLNAVCIGADESLFPLKTIECISSIVASIALIATAIFAWRQIRAFRETERLRETLEILNHRQTNPHWIESRKVFIELRDSKDGLKKHALEKTNEALIIRSTLNQYEVIAIGIKSGIIDEAMYRSYYRGTLLRDWAEAVQFVDEERKENSQYWIELQQLAERFKKNS
jgi:hypothetical protein